MISSFSVLCTERVHILCCIPHKVLILFIRKKNFCRLIATTCTTAVFYYYLKPVWFEPSVYWGLFCNANCKCHSEYFGVVLATTAASFLLFKNVVFLQLTRCLAIWPLHSLGLLNCKEYSNKYFTTCGKAVISLIFWYIAPLNRVIFRQ